MRLTSYAVQGVHKYGVVHELGDTAWLSDLTRVSSAPSLKAFLGGEHSASAHADLLRPDYRFDEVELLPVIPDPRKIVCVGVNYIDHRVEASREPAEHPTIFARFADTQIAHLASARIPAASTKFDYEGELAVVIGRACHHVPAAEAFDVIAGYSCYNDFTARDWQRHTSQWAPGKNFPYSGAFGPWLVTADEIADLAALRLTTMVNGDTRQDAVLSDLIFDIPRLVEYITTFTSLAPGDVIVTGTPGGVGFFRSPPQLLSPGDVVEVSVTGLGTLRNVVA